jgi:SAM-dependent methyltransferase
MGLKTKIEKLVILTLNHGGWKKVICPVCGWHGYSFLKSYWRGKDAPTLTCPICNSKERHRHQALAFKHWDITKKISGKSVLHVAPEQRFKKIFEGCGQYVRFDLDRFNEEQPIDVCSDLSRSCIKSDSIDFVYASHVLEHIEDVELAIEEIYRILRKGGYAFLDVPTYGAKTVRLATRDKDGHIWHPGLEDWFTQYKDAGFDVDFFDSKHVDSRCGVGTRSPITLCYKPG